MIEIAGGKGRRYDVRLSGSIGNLALVSLTDYLRDHRWARRTAAFVGSILAFGGVLVFFYRPLLFRLGLYQETALEFAIPMLIAGGAILIAVLFSGERFSVFVAEWPEVEERRPLRVNSRLIACCMCANV